VTGARRLVAAFQLVAAMTLCAVALAPAAHAAPRDGQAPLFAYYYIWYTPSSWDRAKKDYPLAGRYSSDEREVMREHIRAAKSAGIDGWFVSWKSTEPLNARLEKLVRIAEQEHFKLAIIYQGLDFERKPLPVDQVETDMNLFQRRFASRPPFQGVFEKPLVIWSGTWKFKRSEVAKVMTPERRSKLLMLSSERNVDGIDRLRGLTDGDAYYWSSVNPDTYPGYPQKLKEMGNAVHAEGGLWLAPAAPGFDARMIGGKTVVDRKDGDTLRREMNAATSSSPDAIGLISWNEFSENSHVEPSERNGTRYLKVLADLRGAPGPNAADFDSSEPGTTGSHTGIPLLIGLLLLIVGGIVLTLRRGSGGDRSANGGPSSEGASS
jgi:Glycosyl hydrolase family 99